MSGKKKTKAAGIPVGMPLYHGEDAGALGHRIFVLLRYARHSAQLAQMLPMYQSLGYHAPHHHGQLTPEQLMERVISATGDAENVSHALQIEVIGRRRK